jgi:hypothetical protein
MVYRLPDQISLCYNNYRLPGYVDSDVVDWFKEQGRGYQLRINALLRAYMEAHNQTNQT